MSLTGSSNNGNALLGKTNTSESMQGKLNAQETVTGKMTAPETVRAKVSILETLQGDSAYEVAVQNGFKGTEEEWLESLKGDKGDKGDQGIQGEKGEKGDKGDPGTVEGITPEGIGAAPAIHTHDYLPLAGGSLYNQAEIKLTKYNSRYLTIDGNSFTFDASQDAGTYNLTLAGLKDSTGTDKTLLGVLGNKASGLLWLYMGGSYDNPYFKITADGAASFKNTPTVGGVNVSLDGHTHTASDVGAAPAGYGYGGESVPRISGTEDELNLQFLSIINGMSNLSTKQIAFECNSGTLNGKGRFIGTIYKDDNDYSTINATTYFNNYTVRKSLFGGTFEPFEWVNPHMVPGVEYRTTERWNGKAVYTKLVDLGLSALGTMNIYHNDLGATNMIRNNTVMNNTEGKVEVLPSIYENSFTGKYTAYVTACDANHIMIMVNEGMVGRRIYTTYWYTKD